MEKRAILILSLSALCALGSCSGARVAKDPDVKRISLGQEEYKKPAFFIADFAPSDKGRNPASASPLPSPAEDPKTVYFLSLWQQKLQMESVLGLRSSDVCPAFHQALLANKDKWNSLERNLTLEKDWEAAVKSGDLPGNPVLALPADEGADLYTLYQGAKSLERDEVKSAFENYYMQTKNEVGKLCDTGVSDGYFVFANMVRYYANDKNFMRSSKALEALLKLPVVANYYVLQNLRKGRAPASAFLYEKQALEQLNAEWFQSYVFKVYEKRKRR